MHRSHIEPRASRAGVAALAAALLSLAPRVASAQTPSNPQTTHHAPICAAGVHTYTAMRDVPTPYDTLTMPPGPAVRVTNEDEAAAADLAMRGRAGSVGATGVLVTDTTENIDGGMAMHRHVRAVFVPNDSARAHAACKT
jgi:hypothetical protein